jgi:WD40 repeat protein
MATRYDAFLSYNSKDRGTVTDIAVYLKEKEGLKLFFDQWEMIPGTGVIEALEKGLDEAGTCVVFIGPSGLGDYQEEEMYVALEKSIAKKDLRVIPVLLPGGKRETRESELPPFLRRLSWVEMGADTLEPEALHRLVCGIKNITPGPSDKPGVSPTDICPYRGLEVFREQDRHLFFGRESLVQRLMTRLKKDRFLALIGPSGSGKSSVLQAGLISLLRSDSLIALFTPRERPLEELAFALRKSAAPGQIQYSTAEIVKQLSDSEESLHYLAREILQAQQGDSSKPVQRFVIIVDQLEEIFTLTPLEEDRRKFINLLLRAVEMVGGPVTVILTMRSDFTGKCAPYRDLNIYFSEHLDQVEPMTAAELQAAIENPAQSVGLEFDEGLVEVMLADVKGSGSELPLIGHALWELYHFQPRPGNRLTAQAYEAIGRIEGALVRRAETIYNELTVPQQETLRKMFLLGLIQPGEGAPDTRRRAIKEELLAVGGDAAAAEQLLYQLATARLLTIARDETSGHDTVEVAHEALIRNWDRIGEWMAQGREIARQRGILRQASREWDKNGKNPEYLFGGTRLAQMEDFVSTHGQDLGALEKEFIANGTVEREALQRKKRRNIQAFIGALIAVLVVVTYFAYQAYRSEKKALKQLAVNHWDTARRMRKDNDPLKSLHLFCEALAIEKDKRSREILLTDMNGLWRIVPLLHIFPHEKGIKGARFSKDEARILTWSWDGTTQLWDAATGKPIGAVMKHDNAVMGAIFNKNETRILTWSSDGTARVWDAATGKPIGEVMKHKNIVYGAIFNKNETRILTWSGDIYKKKGTARLWNAATGKPIGEVMKHKDIVYGAIFNKNETRILTWSDDGTARLWDAATSKPIDVVMKHENSVLGAIFNQNEARILTWSRDATARLWEAATGKPTGVVMKHDDDVEGAIFNKDGTRILTWSGDGTARLWDAATGKHLGEFMKHEDDVSGAIFNQDGNRILTWSDDGIVRLWDVTNEKPYGKFLELLDYVYNAIFIKDGTLILTLGIDGSARLWDAATGKSVGEVMKHDGLVKGAIFNRDDTRILTWTGDIFSKNGTARLWDAETGKPLGEVMKHEGKVGGAIFNKKETRILTWTGDFFSKNGTARLWDAATGKPIGSVMKHKAKVNGAVFNGDNTRILTWSEGSFLEGGTAQLWDAATGKPIGEIMEHEKGGVKSAIYNKNETRILTWSDSCIARLWDAAAGTPIGEAMKHRDFMNGAIFNQNGTRILTWSKDGTVRLWDADTGKPIGEAMKHEAEVNGATFNQNGTLILSWSWDGTVRMWDAATGKPIGEVMNHGDEVNGAIFNQNETRILTWSGDGTLRLWDIAIDPDFPMEHIKLQVQTITGTSYDTITNTVKVLPPDQWREIKKKYMKIAAKHYQSCRFPEGNVFRKLFPEEAEKIRPDPPK